MRTCVRDRLRPACRASRSPSPPAGATCWRPARSPWRPSRGASSSSARHPRRPRPTACAPGCGWGRRSRAARRCACWRPIRSGSPTHGMRACARSRASAPPWSRAAPGTAWFGAGGLRTLHGGTLEGVLAARAQRRCKGPVRLGAAPSRFAALAAAGRARARRAEITPMAAAALAAYMAPLPVALLLSRPEVGDAARRARALRDPHAGRAGQAAARRAGRPLRPRRLAGARPRAGQGHAARPAHGGRAAGGAPGAAGVRRRARSSSAGWTC